MAEHLQGSVTPNSAPGLQPCVRAQNSRQGPRLGGGGHGPEGLLPPTASASNSQPSAGPPEAGVTQARSPGEPAEGLCWQGPPSVSDLPGGSERRDLGRSGPGVAFLCFSGGDTDGSPVPQAAVLEQGRAVGSPLSAAARPCPEEAPSPQPALPAQKIPSQGSWTQEGQLVRGESKGQAALPTSLHPHPHPRPCCVSRPLPGCLEQVTGLRQTLLRVLTSWKAPGSCHGSEASAEPGDRSEARQEAGRRLGGGRPTLPGKPRRPSGQAPPAGGLCGAWGTRQGLAQVGERTWGTHLGHSPHWAPGRWGSGLGSVSGRCLGPRPTCPTWGGKRDGGGPGEGLRSGREPPSVQCHYWVHVPPQLPAPASPFSPGNPSSRPGLWGQERDPEVDGSNPALLKHE